MTIELDLCLTIGRRPSLLRQTLTSLLPRANFRRVIAINDFRDQETNDVFKDLCPAGTLISLREHVGHHRAVDLMYSKVTSAYIFHCEDDWLFNSDLMLDESIKLLQSDKNIGSVCLRKIEDFKLDRVQALKKITQSYDGIEYCRLDGAHEQWHGFTFNPHITSSTQWKKFGPFAKFKKERHISRKIRSEGAYVAYIQPGACVHIGDDASVGNPVKKSRFEFLNFFKK